MFRRTLNSRLPSVLAASTVLLLALTSAAIATTPAAKCQAGKNKAAGKYAACRHNAEAKRATNGDAAAYTEALGTCAGKYASGWQKLELNASGACPSNGDETGVANAINQCTSNVANALAGGALVDCPADLAVCESDVATCEAALGGPTAQVLKTGQAACYDVDGNVIACGGTGQDGELQKGLTRSYTDNGDGTITDDRTGLSWEKLSDDGSVHDMTTGYTFTTAVSTKVATLNSTMFAGHSDWRVPNRFELESLVAFDYAAPAIAPTFNTGCMAGCTVTTCSCAANNGYWSSTTYDVIHSWAWYVDFAGGELKPFAKSVSYGVRAVRGG